MTYTDIDKQLDEWFEKCDGYMCGHETTDDHYVIWDEDIKQFLHLIYDQAKAEQREEIAQMVEGKNKYWHIRFEGINDVDESARRKEFNKEVTLLINSVVDDIVSEIRGQHECKQTTQVSLQVKE